MSSTPANANMAATPPSSLSALKIERSGLPTGSSSKRPRWHWVAGGVGGLLVLGLLVGRPTKVEVEAGQVSVAYPTQALTLLNATGYVVAQRKAAVASKATGRLEWLGVTEGSIVKAGELIARLESADVNATLAQAQAGAQAARANWETGEAERVNAERNLQRTRDLFAQNFVSQAAVDDAKARYDSARTKVASLKAAIAVADANAKGAQVSVEQTQIRAPFDGVVLTKNADVGDNVTPFSQALNAKGAVVTMADMNTLEVEADVAEASLGKVQVGQAVEITLDALTEKRFLGKVTRIVPTVDRSKASVLVKVAFIERDARILPEMSAKVAFLSALPSAEQRQPMRVVNPNSIVQRDGKNVVFVIEGEKDKETVQAVVVQTGAKLLDWQIIQNPPSNLASGTKIVLKPTDKLKTGASVKLSASK